MSNTILTAKNTFGDGLVLDISPENTGANNLSSALNATLITANGNEMTLQNDMGNARVETAYLPDGYIPIGTCEFGDIIYIVSYNPLVNKAQIGCFPSPERNISSEEVSGLSQLLSSVDFQVLDDSGYPTGELKTMQVKKTLFDGKQLRPGDKYLVYTNNTNSITFFKNTSNYGTPSKDTDFPRLVKLRLASVDSDGKISYIDSDSTWYEKKGDMDRYFIAYVNKTNGTTDIDSYRSLTNSAYSVFQSKNSGTLTLIAELETIDTFSCAYSALRKDVEKANGKEEKIYEIFLHPSWTSSNNNISIDGIVIEGNYFHGSSPILQPPYTLELSRSYKPELCANYSSFIKSNYNTEIKKQLLWEKFIINVNKLEEKWEEVLLENPQLNQEEYNTPDKKVEYLYNKLNVLGEYIYQNTVYFLTPESLKIMNFPEINNVTLRKLEIADGTYTSKYYPNLTQIVDNKYYTTIQNKNFELSPQSINSDILNYKFNKEDTISVLQFRPTSSIAEKQLQDFKWNIMVYPRMPYGRLDHLGIPLTIDFSKIGTNSIELTHWKYHNDGLLSTLTYGFSINLANNYKVKQVAFEFYDDKGLVAVYKSNEKVSYSGIFTERLGLNGENLNYKLSNIDLNGDLIYHAGSISSEGEVQLGQDGTSELKPSLKPGQEVQSISETNNDVTYLNDSGVLYTNKLYGVKILVEYGVVNELGEMISVETKEFYRWYWTNDMFNDKYFQENDFNFDSITLGLGCNYVLQSTDDFKTTQVAYYNGNIGASDVNLPKTLGADTTYIKGPMSLKLDVGLSENYSTFIPSTNLQVDCKVGLGYKNIIQSYSEIASEDGTTIRDINSLKPDINTSNEDIWSNKGKILQNLLGINNNSTAKEIWGDSDGEGKFPYEQYKSQFNLKLSENDIESDKYMFNDVEHDVQYKREVVLTSGIQTDIELRLEGISFDKVMYSGIESIPKDYPIVESLWSSDAFKGMLGIKEGKVPYMGYECNVHYFTDVLAITTPTDGHDGILKKFVYSTPESYETITEHKDRQITPKNKNYQYNNSELLSAIDKLGFTGPLILLSWCSSNRGDYDIEQETLKIDNIIINKHGNTDQSSLPSILTGIQSGLNNSMGAFFQLALYKPNTYLYLLNDVFNYYESNGKSKGVNFPQVPGILNGGGDLYKSAEPNQGLADMLAKVFSNIYYKSYQTSEVELPKFTDLAYANNFKEIWNQHLILNINQSNEESNKKTDYSDKINLLGSRKSNSEYYTVSDYIEKINTFTNNKMPNFEILLAQALQVIDCNIDVPSSKLLKTIYSRKASEPQAVWFKDGDKKNPLYVYSNVDDTLFQENNGELAKLSKNFTYNISSEKTATCDLSWIEYDPEIFIKVDRYPKGNYYKIGNTYSEDLFGGYRYYENASKDATITGFWNVIK